MNASELKYNYELNNPNGHFFDRKTMRFFGDNMANYGVRKTHVNLTDCYELYRKKPVKHGLKKSAYFCPITFKQI
jgi:hypothetical protein